tara:strand:- start:5223 stop:6065 length:843 start_codon:yes stop_codon:yes gene_type:complete
MLRTVLQLVRFPGIFTAFSNVLIGFFLASEGNLELTELPFLITTTGLLFSGGMMLNDFVDYRIDQVERSNRPIPSKKISREKTLVLIILSFSIANFSALMIGNTSAIIALILTGMIFSYNLKLKNISIIGIVSISGIRFLNVIFGFSIVGISFDLIQYAIPVSLLVAGISILAKNELNSNRSDQILNKILLTCAVMSVIFLIIQHQSWNSIIFLVSFLIIVIYSISRLRTNISKIITIQILSIIFLDATVVTLNNDLFFGVITASLIIPGYFIAKKLYIT